MENPNNDGAAFPPVTDTAHLSDPAPPPPPCGFPQPVDPSSAFPSPAAARRSLDSSHRQLIQSMVANLSESDKVKLIMKAASHHAVVREELLTKVVRDESRKICVHIRICEPTTPVKLFRVLKEFGDIDDAIFQWWFQPDYVIALVSFVNPSSATWVLETPAEDVEDLQLQWHAYTANCAACRALIHCKHFGS
ncbi:high affinity immunoglobulin alpha andimmunoglobulin mu Fc receptor [Striga asiatica]|uniref:High affinity immunoglobulin alpha andimmunoglobulin mu Fc receptor n=1 Tax=Striga asiatica TaxID=4170 RepID=A0A5A7PG01_STRAF|nr:high affinity immunoglobulin alpha andimmunoglobulin mu Fc receptor [Striga asiatica]